MVSFDKNRVDAANALSCAREEAHKIDYSKNFRAGATASRLMSEKLEGYHIRYFAIKPMHERKQPLEADEREQGQTSIRDHGPRSNNQNQFVEWAGTEVNREGSKIFGWPAAEAETAMRNRQTGRTNAKPITRWTLTVKDCAGWFLNGIISPMNGTLRMHGVMWIGELRAGKSNGGCDFAHGSIGQAAANSCDRDAEKAALHAATRNKYKLDQFKRIIAPSLEEVKTENDSNAILARSHVTVVAGIGVHWRTASANLEGGAEFTPWPNPRSPDPFTSEARDTPSPAVRPLPSDYAEKMAWSIGYMGNLVEGLDAPTAATVRIALMFGDGPGRTASVVGNISRFESGTASAPPASAAASAPRPDGAARAPADQGDGEINSEGGMGGRFGEPPQEEGAFNSGGGVDGPEESAPAPGVAQPPIAGRCGELTKEGHDEQVETLKSLAKVHHGAFEAELGRMIEQDERRAPGPSAAPPDEVSPPAPTKLAPQHAPPSNAEVSQDPSWLKGARGNSWAPILRVVNLLRLGRPRKDIEAEIEAGRGNYARFALLAWRGLYQETLGKGAVSLGDRAIGGTQRATRKLPTMGALKRQPARTIHRNQEPTKRDSNYLKTRKGTAKRAPATKKAAARTAKKPAANLKNAGRWLWLATRVGLGKTACAHEKKNKMIADRLRLRVADAQGGAPRGLGGIKVTLEEKVKKGTFLVQDGWTSTTAAAKALGYTSAPPVAHEKNCRDPAAGFRANDAESENSRLTGWDRQRYGQLQLGALGIEEYAFHVNAGDTVESMFEGLSHANGGPRQNRLP
ncbi:unnamed protein product [Prorocentrum cordatum]|uniref:Uncharacterized protein n=1 Tax=Prorocentrum cordatum TaxID=2364126 RepID=A0ABN9TG97_9DINO|nr:unnamed protein product [Polarella glacialis]